MATAHAQPTVVLAEMASTKKMAPEAKRMRYERGTCEGCGEAMLVLASQPGAPCIKCHANAK